MNRVILRKGRERSLLRFHPWVFSGAVGRVEGSPAAGDTIEVTATDGRLLGFGAWSPASQIRVRMWSFNEHDRIDEAFFHARIQAAIDCREGLCLADRTTAYRLVAAEADGLPGLIVDRYNEFLVCQFLSVGVEKWKPVILAQLAALPGIEGIYERSEAAVRTKEGLPPRQGAAWGAAPPPLVVIEEDDIRFKVDVMNGHKTGFYLDQRDNRRLVAGTSAGMEVLNCFSYTGGFGLAALHGGAGHVTNIEDVAALVALADDNVRLNGFAPDRVTNMKGDVFRQLRRFHEDGIRFDMVILDPPKFAESMGHLNRAARGYKDINRLACHLLKPGGTLFTFSCSGLMKMDLFQKIVTDGALEAGCTARITRWLGQAPDHPIVAHIPETLYLKGLMMTILPH
ncbi:class I SAM-dependent methyltransferase [bacterium]|nr:class I SAM-dependent methyltransferase [candidate division CSSED10-310 bacterium]